MTYNQLFTEAELQGKYWVRVYDDERGYIDEWNGQYYHQHKRAQYGEYSVTHIYPYLNGYAVEISKEV